MHIALKLLQKYHKPTIRETGIHIKYDQEQLGQPPDKLAKWYKHRNDDQGNTIPTANPSQTEIIKRK